MRLIPAIDLKSGRCVRLLKGDFAQETIYAQSPASVLARFLAMGADWVHVVDLDGAAAGQPVNHALIASLASAGAALQVGGGLRDTASVRRAFEAGARRVVIGSTALEDVCLVRGWFELFGAARLVLAFDVRLDVDGVPRVATHGWQRQTQRTLWEAVSLYAAAGLEHVLCTDVERDGALSGPNLALYAEAVRRFPPIRWQASGGIRSGADLHSLAACGAAAAVSGKALLEGLLKPEELRPFLPNA